ncbi:MAG: hypothetical protein V3S16_17695 [Candidatus Desulfatibia sp.]|uniref:hypothetical protein n=1 Tax=Candidatus Desulfatibia sp. TaxID=3101189 RepID=UPI002F33AFFC
MKNFCFTNLMIILVVAFVVGCQTTQDIKSTISSKVTTLTTGVDPSLYKQVPEDQKEGVPSAESALKFHRNKEHLIKLKKELAIQKLKLAGYNLDLASKDRKKAQILLDTKKLEAIDRAGLGEKEDNLDTIADLKSKILKIEADKVKIRAKIAAREVHIKDQKKQIEEQDEKIKGMKAD